MKLIAFTRECYKSEAFSLHRAGCADLKKEQANFGAHKIGTAESIQDGIDLILDSEMVEMGYTARDIKIYPCCKS